MRIAAWNPITDPDAPRDLVEPHRISVAYRDATIRQAIRSIAVAALTPRHYYVLERGWLAGVMENSSAPMVILQTTVEIQRPEERFSNQAGTDGWWPLANVEIMETL